MYKMSRPNCIFQRTSISHVIVLWSLLHSTLVGMVGFSASTLVYRRVWRKTKTESHYLLVIFRVKITFSGGCRGTNLYFLKAQEISSKPRPEMTTQGISATCAQATFETAVQITDNFPGFFVHLQRNVPRYLLSLLWEMSGSEREGKGENKMVSIPLSSDEETSVGASIFHSSEQTTSSLHQGIDSAVLKG